MLKQIAPARGHENGSAPTRSGAAKNAGISEHQRKTMLRVASVPEDDFERQVESDKPPTVTELARQGTAKREDARPVMRNTGSVAQFRSATTNGGRVTAHH